MNELEIACCFELIVIENIDLSQSDFERILKTLVKVNKKYHFFELIK